MPVDQVKKEEIRKESKKLLDKFSKALDGIKSVDVNVVRDEDRRVEEEGLEGDKEFRDVMFENAPSVNKDFLIAEKKTW